MYAKRVLVIEKACPPELLAEVRAKFPNPIVVSSLAQARQRLRNSNFDLVLCGVHLPDGNWAEVLSCLVNNGLEAELIVCAPYDDSRLRAEVLGRGGYAMAWPPYDLPELPFAELNPGSTEPN